MVVDGGDGKYGAPTCAPSGATSADGAAIAVRCCNSDGPLHFRASPSVGPPRRARKCESEKRKVHFTGRAAL